jgi:hypothetical protein
VTQDPEVGEVGQGIVSAVDSVTCYKSRCGAPPLCPSYRSPGSYICFFFFFNGRGEDVGRRKKSHDAPSEERTSGAPEVPASWWLVGQGGRVGGPQPQPTSENHRDQEEQNRESGHATRELGRKLRRSFSSGIRTVSRCLAQQRVTRLPRIATTRLISRPALFDRPDFGGSLSTNPYPRHRSSSLLISMPHPHRGHELIAP